jgi:hypothetical protein
MRSRGCNDLTNTSTSPARRWQAAPPYPCRRDSGQCHEISEGWSQSHNLRIGTHGRFSLPFWRSCHPTVAPASRGGTGPEARKMGSPALPRR